MIAQPNLLTSGLVNRVHDRERTIMRIVDNLNELARAYDRGHTLTYIAVRDLLDWCNWRCSSCQGKHTPGTSLTAEHIFVMGNNRWGQNVQANVRITCLACSRQGRPKDDSLTLVEKPEPKRKRASLSFATLAAA